MKKILFIIAVLLFVTPVFAQTQKGYVKTKGRMVNGQHVPGEGLKGAMVAVKGRTPVLVNKDDGEFSFQMRDDQFSFDSVKKKGYQLIDADACTRIYKPSGNPIYFVMETPEQQLQDRLTAERKIRRNLQKQLQDKEDEIEELKEQQKITTEEYRAALQNLYAEQENNEQLISDMAKRYSELDYDQLDEFYRKVSMFIENGELTKADSLLNTKGDVSLQVEEEIQKGKAIQEQRRKLKKAEAVHAANIDELAKRCYSYYETFLAQHLNDTAGYYIELRASLDTTNIAWQNEAGEFFCDFVMDFDKSMGYYNTALRQVEKMDNNYDELLNSYTNIESLYMEYGNFEKMKEYVNKSIDMVEKGLCTNPLKICDSYSNLGAMYYFYGDYEKAVENYEKVLEMQLKMLNENDVNLGTTYNNLGFVYTYMADFDKAMDALEKALKIWTYNYGENHPDVSLALSNIGNLYLYDYYSGFDIDKAMECYQKALEIRRSVFGEMHSDVAISYGNIGNVYNWKKEYDKALEYRFKALAINEYLFDENYFDLAIDYGNIGRIYRNKGDYDKALEYFQKGLHITYVNFGENHPDYASDLVNMSYVYRDKGDYAKSLELCEKALNIRKSLMGENSVYVGETYVAMGNTYNTMKDYANALENYQKAYEIYRVTNGEDFSTTQKLKGWIEIFKEKIKDK